MRASDRPTASNGEGAPIDKQNRPRSSESKSTVWQRLRMFAFGAVLWAGVGTVGAVIVREFGWLTFPGDNWTLLICAFFLVFVSRIDDLALLSLGPLKAELRAKITEASATVDQLRTIAAALTGFVLSEAAASWFQDGQPADGQLELADECGKALDRIGVSAEDNTRARERWDIGVAMVFAREIANEVERVKRGGKTIAMEIAPASPIFMSMRPWHASRPEEIEAELKKRELIVGDVAELIADYKQFVADGTLRRRDVFAKAAAG